MSEEESAEETGVAEEPEEDDDEDEPEEVNEVAEKDTNVEEERYKEADPVGYSRRRRSSRRRYGKK